MPYLNPSDAINSWFSEDYLDQAENSFIELPEDYPNTEDLLQAATEAEEG